MGIWRGWCWRCWYCGLKAKVVMYFCVASRPGRRDGKRAIKALNWRARKHLLYNNLKTWKIYASIDDVTRCISHTSFFQRKTKSQLREGVVFHRFHSTARVVAITVNTPATCTVKPHPCHDFKQENHEQQGHVKQKVKATASNQENKAATKGGYLRIANDSFPSMIMLCFALEKKGGQGKQGKEGYSVSRLESRHFR